MSSIAWSWLIAAIWIAAATVFTCAMRRREHKARHQERLELFASLRQALDGEE